MDIDSNITNKIRKDMEIFINYYIENSSKLMIRKIELFELICNNEKFNEFL